ncbi:hypothetical protein V2J09_010836 [Rumex salicifolius]
MPHLLPLPAGWSPFTELGPTNSHFLTTVASLHLGQFLSRRLLLRSPLQDLWNGRALKLKGLHYITWSSDAVSAASSAFFSNDNQSGHEARNRRSSPIETSKGSPYQRRWTNVLLAANVLIYVAQIATQGKLMLWGAKINNLIDQGQLWRLVTSSFLHANIGHLLINCYSLNSVGPAVETISGSQRFFGIYFTSAVASTAMSYWLCKAPAVGASGAIFGLVGSVAVFVKRHRGEVGRGTEDLQQIARVIALNMVIGLMSRGIDNWGHLGGLLGGSAISWFLGPAWKYESVSKDGRRVYTDRAPISYIRDMKKPPRAVDPLNDGDEGLTSELAIPISHHCRIELLTQGRTRQRNISILPHSQVLHHVLSKPTRPEIPLNNPLPKQIHGRGPRRPAPHSLQPFLHVQASLVSKEHPFTQTHQAPSDYYLIPNLAALSAP